jgi:hypothetical protein
MTMDSIKYYLVTSEQVNGLEDITDDNTTGLVEVRSDSEDKNVQRRAKRSGDFLLDISKIAMSAPEYVGEQSESVDKAVDKLLS